VSTPPAGRAARPDGGASNRRAYGAAIVSFVVAIGGGIAAAVGYGTDATGDLLGLGLAAALSGIGLGLVAWAKYLDLDEHVVQPREPLTTTPQQQAELAAEVDATVDVLGRRRLLLGLGAAAFLSMVVGFVGPIGSLGPKPRGERGQTSWRPGSRLVTADGTPIESSAQPYGELVTVFPEGHVGVDDSQVVLMRVRPDRLSARTTAAGTPEGWVAYSKICTHAGCSVGLLGIDDRPPDVLTELVCPCHQSVFDPLDAARPVGGPATRPLPQLGLEIDAAGHLVAIADFDRPVGPLAWDEA
jgi:ubiquinol-cytochrome c reductase iron-sulfur subunit